MEFEYKMTKTCGIGGEVTLTILVSANNGMGCQIDALERPVDCDKQHDCPGGSRCLLKEINMDDDTFNLWDQY